VGLCLSLLPAHIFESQESLPMPLFDLSHTFTDDIPVYPGDPCAQLKKISDVSQNGFCDHLLTSGMHVGTHVDAPQHVFADGKSIDALPLSCFEGKGVLVDVRGVSIIEDEHLPDELIRPGVVVLFWTGWDRFYRTNRYFEDWPVLSKEAAKHLAVRGVVAAGFDTPGPDADANLITHKILLSDDVLIIENLTQLSALEGWDNFKVRFFPTKYAADAAHVRVVADCKKDGK
jgi:kynurenine formamidase